MTTNFAFVKVEWEEIYHPAARAESLANTDPRTACFHARRALEIAVDWIYEYDEELSLPYDDQLSSKIFADDFRDNTPRAVFTKIDYIRRIGNEAVHSKRVITVVESMQTVRELFHVLYWLARSYTKGEPSQFDGLQFVEANVPTKQVSIPVNTFKQLKAVYKEAQAKKQEEAELEKQRRIVEPAIDAELDRLRKQIAAAKKKNEKFQDTHNYSEADTRKHIIDLMLREAGWTLGSDATVELEVAGMPNNQGLGYVDYVLWGGDGKPLAVIEAKKTSIDAAAGKHQAKLYADCVEALHGQRPLIFYTNGYEINLWDDLNYPPRPVQGFYTKDELDLMIQRRLTRKPLNADDVDRSIVERHYQTRAIQKIAERLEGKQRKALLVMATGAGKTRTVIALCDLLQRAGWVKRVLFLADRVALVSQACNAFKTHLPNANAVNLVTEREETGSRVYVSTYPTMMNLINDMDGDRRRFGTGYFDLIVVDEAHRSIYQKYKAIFEYFDSFLVGLTATPKAEVDKNTYRMFDLQSGVPTDAYELDEAVKDGFLVPSINISVPTKFIRQGIKYEELSDEEKDQWDEIEWNEEGEVPEAVDPAALNNWLFNQDTIDLVLKYLMENGVRVEGGDKLGKTIIFAKNRKHAAVIVERFDKNYPHLKGEFAAAIDYKTKYAQKLLDNFYIPAKLPQIAVSVDMLDTGIDVPEILNLVFFKAVRSKTKFIQMIGRGTRLRQDLFGPGKNKEYFYIFDYCQNFEYFNQGGAEAEAKLQESLSAKIFSKRVELIDSIRRLGDGNAEMAKLDDTVTEHLQLQVEAMNTDNFVVRPHRQAVEKFKDQKAWESIDPDSYYELTKIIASLPTELDGDDETAKRFDFLVLKLQLSILNKHKDYAKLRDQVIEIAKRLEEKETIPMVNNEMELILDLQRDDFWQDITVPMLESVRKRLRDLVQFIDAAKRAIIYTDFEDEIGEAVEVGLVGSSGVNVARYKAKMLHFLQNEENHIALQKLKRNKPITASDIAELERIFFESGEIGTREEFEDAYGRQENLGLFIRSLVGLDRHEAKLAFADFLDGQRYNSNQIEFVNLIIDHLTQNGVMDAALLYEPPYTNFSSNGLSGLFDDSEAVKIVDLLDQIRMNAAA